MEDGQHACFLREEDRLSRKACIRREGRPIGRPALQGGLDLQAIIDGDADKIMPHPNLSAEEKSEYVLAAGWLLIGANKAHLAAKLAMSHYRNVSAGSVTSAKYRQLMRAAWTHDGFTAKSDKAKTSSLERTKSLVKQSVALQIEKREKD